MEYECGPVLLYSQDKVRMMDFLSDVFEFDVDCVSDSVQRGHMIFKLCELSHSPQNLNNNNGVVFSFRVKSEDELKEIMSKYNFFLYRKAQSQNTAEKLELIQNDDKTTLIISDIDQRLWRFELAPRIDF
jgi:hypothetical protein